TAPVPPPILPYSDGGGAVMADSIIDWAIDFQRNGNQALHGQVNANVAIATSIAQMAAVTWGLTHTHDGVASAKNPFFDDDLNLLSGSDVMREGPEEARVPIETDINVPVFSRQDLMLGDFNQDPGTTQNAYNFFINNVDIGQATRRVRINNIPGNNGTIVVP